MKLLYVISGQSYSTNNHSRKIASLVNCWTEMGHQVELVCGGDLLPSFRKESVAKNVSNQGEPPWYRRTKILQPLVNTVSEIANIRHDQRLANFIRKKIEQFQPDLYIQRSSRIDGRTLNTAIQSGVPTVLEWKDNIVVSKASRKSIGRGDLYGFGFLKPYARWVETWKEANTPWLIVESEVLKQRLNKYLKRDPKHFVVAHNAVNASDFSLEKTNRKTLRQQLGLPTDKFLAVFVGSFNWYQHVEYLVQAIANSRCPERIQAVLVGDGKNRNQCQELARQLDVEDRVTFVGQVARNEVPNYLSAADVAVLPHCTEIITPIKVQEYMAMGLTSLVPDFTANREILEDGVTGVLFEPANIDAMVDQLIHLESDREMCERIGKEARRIVESRYSWEATWGQAITHIHQLADGTRH